jgi:S-adenosyl-L-methionine hydrolase (adenosine-forming)
MTIITLMTDFGLKDGNVGVMKGVILGIAPQAQIVDLSHLISPQGIAEASLILYRSAPHFPPGTIHLAVVDPGVGTSRRPMAARLGAQYYIGPDNGTITLLLEHLENQGQPNQFYQLDQAKFWLPEISHVFHGRDIFAPCAAHLAAGVSLNHLGTPFDDPVRLALPRPERTTVGWHGQVIHIDHFGNLATNIRSEHIQEILDQQSQQIVVSLRDVEIQGMVKTFGERPAGDLVALLGSTGNLIISMVNGSAATRLEAKVGDEVTVSCAIKRSGQAPS